MELRILGPLEAWEGGSQLSLPSGRQRALLALLLLHAGEAVSSERLIDLFWEGQPPATAAKVVQGYVSQLRRALPEGAIETRGSGYLLRVGETDAAEFERLLDRARDQAPGEAARTLRSALALWRGPPLADVEYESWARPEIARLEELKLGALEERIAADLELGASSQLVAELEALIAEHPLRERLRTELMLALYRCDRQADALQAFADARSTLVEGLGIEPGPELKHLQRRILDQDPGLAAASRPVVRAARRAPWLVLAGGLLLAGGAAAAGLLIAAGRSPGSVTVPPNSVAVISPASDRVVRAIAVGATPTSIAVDSHAVWVVNSDEETLSRIDPIRDVVVNTISSGPAPTALALGVGRVWVMGASSVLRRIDPDTDLVTIERVPRARDVRAGGLGPNWVASNGTAVWATNDATVSRVVPQPQLAIAITAVACCGTVALGAGSVWTTDDSGLLRLDAHTGARETHVKLSFLSGDINATAVPLAIGDGSVWVADQSGNTVWRIDARNGTAVIGTLAVGDHPSGIAVGAGAVWVASADGTVSRIDPSAAQGLGRVVRTIHVGGTPNGIAVGEGKVWVSVD
ncbi:MAG: extracellular solute-binding protein [Solirubrobacterales bacterium]|nr:extracellular solute-binding protein [Solirubrobacterales bacterium]